MPRSSPGGQHGTESLLSCVWRHPVTSQGCGIIKCGLWPLPPPARPPPARPAQQQHPRSDHGLGPSPPGGGRQGARFMRRPLRTTASTLLSPVSAVLAPQQQVGVGQSTLVCLEVVRSPVYGQQGPPPQHAMDSLRTSHLALVPPSPPGPNSVRGRRRACMWLGEGKGGGAHGVRVCICARACAKPVRRDAPDPKGPIRSQVAAAQGPAAADLVIGERCKAWPV